VRLTLYIAAKAPRPGLAKTRLGQTIGDERAVALYRAFLTDIGERFAHAPFALGWYITPPDAWPEIQPLAGLAGQDVQVLTQGEGDWTERQRQLFSGAAARGEGPLILIASDSPQLSLETALAAFEALAQHDLVFGPTYDGGYYLIGMRRWYDVLGGIPMSTNTVLSQILIRAADAGLTVAEVEATFDVDAYDDLMSLRQYLSDGVDLPATRAACEALGLFARTADGGCVGEA